MRQRLRVAVIGCGAQAQLVYIPALKAHRSIELVALCDPDARKLNHLCQQHSITRRFVDFDALRRDDAIDAVLIATPNHLHAPMAIAAMQSGKDVLCEVPMALNADEAQHMVATAVREKRRLMPCLVTRLRPDVQTIRRFIESNELGRLYYCKTGWLQGREAWSTSGWRGQMRRAGGGAFLSLATSLLDSSLWLLAPAKPVSLIGVAHRRDPHAEVEDTAFAMIRFDSGLLHTVEVGWSLLMEKDFTYFNVFGSTGAALLNPITIHKEMHGHLVNVTPQIQTKGLMRAAYNRLIDVWVTSLLDDVSPQITAADGLLISQLADAFYASHAARAEVTLKSNPT
uniref:Gfo/Idh/MocA family oxidoreductase n=1 Tax=candidate division WOR-3 bacterium TaxID=2052148 RepID=A0A7C4CCW7_UNCW3